MVRFTPWQNRSMNDAVIEAICRYPAKGLSRHPLAQA
jgi:hypothetical protein